jgi:hypothetical protein
MVTPKNKEITSNKLETTGVHCCGGEPKILLLQLFNEYSWDYNTTIRVSANNYQEEDIRSLK